MSDEILGHCDVCRRAITRTRFSSHPEDFSDGCSDFCASVTAEERAKFKAGLVVGEFGVYPCSECGTAIDDEYTVGGWCAGCSPRRRARVRGELLTECIGHVPEALRARIEAALRE